VEAQLCWRGSGTRSPFLFFFQGHLCNCSGLCDYFLFSSGSF
jgi:hypothetical protein